MPKTTTTKYRIASSTATAARQQSVGLAYPRVWLVWQDGHDTWEETAKFRTRREARDYVSTMQSANQPAEGE